MGPFDSPQCQTDCARDPVVQGPNLTTSIFLDALRLGIVDPALVMCVQENEDYEEWRQNGGSPDLLFWPGMLTYR